DISYENQLLLKKEYLFDLLGDIAPVGEVFPAEPFRYRSRMDMVAAFGKIGLREEGSYRFVVDIAECPIMQGAMEERYISARAALASVEGYNYLRHEGYLRYIVLRQARFTGETMLNLVTASGGNRIPDITASLADSVDSMSLLVNGGMADLSFGDVISDIKKGFIEEDFDGVRYRISPNSFFQSNPLIAREMYRRIKTAVKGRVIDLYSGVGSISLFVADSAESVTGVELSAESVAAAELNRQLNGAENVKFIQMDAKDHIYAAHRADTLILDPPRSGIHPSMIKHILNMNPERIIYMSCNPAAFKESAAGLEGYKIETFEAFDMFPQTPHVETLAILQKTV
ncbi:MAG: 23S rRNA (uracil(1939)-C(5))-methyltransferase RlmD, partial [Spirochaetia bacterium]|nr:23S rRNA (uracil(1939)-C(5))-methyltransferase RlmD [Spirochaetia bacterium]